MLLPELTPVWGFLFLQVAGWFLSEFVLQLPMWGKRCILDCNEDPYRQRFAQLLGECIAVVAPAERALYPTGEVRRRASSLPSRRCCRRMRERARARICRVQRGV